jgi:hypothetical protein
MALPRRLGGIALTPTLPPDLAISRQPHVGSMS